MLVEMKFQSEGTEPWYEEHEVDFSLPEKAVITVDDFGGICWPDVIDTYVATHSGAINSSELIEIRRVA